MQAEWILALDWATVTRSSDGRERLHWPPPARTLEELWERDEG